MRLFLWLPGYAGGGVTGVADGAGVAGWGCCWGCFGADEAGEAGVALGLLVLRWGFATK